MASRQALLWQLLALSIAMLMLSIADGSSATGVSGFGTYNSRLRRVHKSTHSDGSPLERTPMQSVESQAGTRSTMAKRTIMKTTAATVTATLKQHVDQAVQKVRSRSKEIQMEQEQKRVDRKLRRDQKKMEREQTAPVAAINPHNLQMPDCPTGKYYNGRRCVAMSKMPKH